MRYFYKSQKQDANWTAYLYFIYLKFFFRKTIKFWNRLKVDDTLELNVSSTTDQTSLFFDEKC